MAKIIQFNQSPTFYKDIALDYLDKGDYIQSLVFLHKAEDMVPARTQKGAEIRLHKAEVYYYMDLNQEALKEYFKLFRYNVYMDEVFFGIIRSLAIMGNVEDAALYLNMGIDFGIFDEEDGLEKIENLGQQFRLVKDMDEEKTALFSVARSLLDISDVSLAKEVLEGIESSENSRDRVIAAKCLCVVHLMRGEFQQAIDKADIFLENEPDDIDAISKKIIALHALNRFNEANELTEFAMSLNAAEEIEINHLFVAARTIQNARYIAELGEKILKKRPYSYELYQVAIAYTHLNNFKRAKELIIKALIIYSSDRRIKNAAKIIDRGEVIPFEEMIPKIKGELGNFNRKETLQLIAEYEASLETACLEIGIYTAMSECYDPIQYEKKIREFSDKTQAESVRLENEMLDILVDPDVDFTNKKAVLLSFLRHSKNKAFFLVVDVIIKEFNPVNLRVAGSAKLIEAFWNVYATAAFLSENFDKQLYIAYKKLAKKSIKEEFTLSAYSAALAYLSEITPVFKKKAACYEVFDANKLEVAKLLAIVKENKNY